MPRRESNRFPDPGKSGFLAAANFQLSAALELTRTGQLDYRFSAPRAICALDKQASLPICHD
jgi:hypothetical protein